jgi:Domain of unknown function (DUF4398)
MRVSAFTILVSITGAAACGASYPEPTVRMAEAMSAERSAEEVGANSNPEAQLHIKLAQEQIAQAKALMGDGENKRAEYALVRAKGDAELALALARAVNAKVEAQQAIDKSNALRAQNAQTMQNAVPAPNLNPGAAQ